jgi:hypothetical protein
MNIPTYTEKKVQFVVHEKPLSHKLQDVGYKLYWTNKLGMIWAAKKLRSISEALTQLIG